MCLKFIVNRIPDEVQPQVPPQVAPSAADGDDSFDDDLGPNFGSIPNLSGSGGNSGEAGSKIDRVKRALHSYEQHSNGYVPIFLFFSNLSLHTVMRWITLRGRIGSRIRR